MSLRIDPVDFKPGTLSIGFTGRGVLGSSIPSTGQDGPALHYPDLVLPGDLTKEIRVYVVTPPSGATLFLNENGSYTMSGPGTFTYNIDTDGVPGVPASVVYEPAAGSTIELTGAIALEDASADGQFNSVASGTILLSGNCVLDEMTADGLFTINAPIAPVVMSGSIALSDVAASGTFSIAYVPGDSFLILEDGTGRPDSNSYADRFSADTYFLARQNMRWAALTDAKKDAALIQATDYIELRFADLFAGERLYPTQALSWPRANVPAGEMPPSLVRACYEYAFAWVSGTLVKSATSMETGALKEKRVQAGPIVTDYKYYNGGGSSEVFMTNPTADILIGRLCVSTFSKVIR